MWSSGKKNKTDSFHDELPGKLVEGRGYYRKRGSASYIVREVHSVREREREIQREREKDGSDVTVVALFAMNFALLLAKNVHLSIGEEFSPFLAKKCAPQFLPS